MNSTALKAAFREYLSVHDGITLGGHALDSLAGDLTRIVEAMDAEAGGADTPITWPKARDVGRIGDMSPSAHMRVGFDSDNDVLVSVWDERGGGCIEFCNPGGGGGGQSSRTRMALIALMVAMEADNAEKPSRDWWAQRAAQAAQQGGDKQ